jgi:6-phosphogluconolactonase/glucosamine-6-phosphate isomerase/deaminase
VPREALTVGPRTLLAAREILLIVTGEDKAESLRGARGPDRIPTRPPRCCAITHA